MYENFCLVPITPQCTTLAKKGLLILTSGPKGEDCLGGGRGEKILVAQTCKYKARSHLGGGTGSETLQL